MDRLKEWGWRGKQERGGVKTEECSCKCVLLIEMKRHVRSERDLGLEKHCTKMKGIDYDESVFTF